MIRVSGDVAGLGVVVMVEVETKPRTDTSSWIGATARFTGPGPGLAESTTCMEALG